MPTFDAVPDTCASCGSPVEKVVVHMKNGHPVAESLHCGHPFRITLEQYEHMRAQKPEVSS